MSPVNSAPSAGTSKLIESCGVTWGREHPQSEAIDDDLLAVTSGTVPRHHWRSMARTGAPVAAKNASTAPA